MSHSLTVSNNEVYSDGEFDLWSVHSGERFNASCFFFVFFCFFVFCCFFFQLPSCDGVVKLSKSMNILAL